MSTGTRRIVLGLLVLLVTASGALGSGFSIYEQSGKASGMAGAWVARADDAAANWYNPAAIVWLDKTQLQVGTNFITAGSNSTLKANDPSFGIFSPTEFKPESSIETPSHLYFTSHINDRIAWGIGINTPFGLVTEWAKRPITYSAKKSELATFVFNPNLAFKVNDAWALAVGLDYMYADIKEFSREVPIDLDRNPLNGFEITGYSNLSGTGNDWGFNLAMHYNGPAYDFGLTYRSKLSPAIDGDAEFRNFSFLQPFFPNGPGKATLKLPEQVTAGLSWGNEPWSFEVDVAYAGWSSFKEIKIDFAREVPGFVEDTTLVENWGDTFSYRFGGSYRSSDTNEWRFGALYDESPVPENYLRPSIPDADRYAVTFGYGYIGQRWNIDLYYMPLWFKDITARSGEEGVIGGEYSTFVNLAGITFNLGF